MNGVVKATRFNSREEVKAAGSPPGAYILVDQPGGIRGIEFLCPCCGTPSYLNLIASHPGPFWSWNGDEDKPTLKPSIFNTGMKCRWHGYLTDGEFVPC